MGVHDKAFTHDCDECEFLGHFLGHDVYQCQNPENPFQSVIARYGTEADYISYPAEILLALLEQNGDVIQESSVTMMETSSQAMLMGLSVKYLRASKKGASQ